MNFRWTKELNMKQSHKKSRTCKEVYILNGDNHLNVVKKITKRKFNRFEHMKCA